MSNEEQIFAYKELRNNGQAFFIDNYEDADRIIEALEKQIPQKIKQDIVNGKMARWCPNGCDITDVTMWTTLNYCPYCGQKIDWSEWEF